MVWRLGVIFEERAISDQISAYRKQERKKYTSERV